MTNMPINLNFNPLNLLNLILVHSYINDEEAWIIQEDTHGPWNHAFLQRENGLAVSQNILFNEIPLNVYAKAGNILGFWSIVNLTTEEWEIINEAITADLKGPIWNRFYNFINLIGQALRQYWISMPGQNICSQRMAKYLRLLPRLRGIVPPDPSPVDLGNIFQANPGLFNFVGYWWQI